MSNFPARSLSHLPTADLIVALRWLIEELSDAITERDVRSAVESIAEMRHVTRELGFRLDPISSKPAEEPLPGQMTID